MTQLLYTINQFGLLFIKPFKKIYELTKPETSLIDLMKLSLLALLFIGLSKIAISPNSVQYLFGKFTLLIFFIIGTIISSTTYAILSDFIAQFMQLPPKAPRLFFLSILSCIPYVFLAPLTMLLSSPTASSIILFSLKSILYVFSIKNLYSTSYSRSFLLLLIPMILWTPIAIPLFLMKKLIYNLSFISPFFNYLGV